MRTNLKRVMSGVAALAIAAGVAPLMTASGAAAAPAGTAPNGSLSLTPASGNSDTNFVINPDDPQTCPGDGATDGYRWQTFMTPTSVDPATLTYGVNGPNAQAGEFTQPLFDIGGNPVVNQNPDIGTANISGIPQMDFAVFGPGNVPPGEYYIGIACTLSGVTETFWQLPITITTNTTTGGTSQLDYTVGARAAVPTLTSVTPGDDGTLEAAFTAGDSVPADTSYTVSATDGTNTFTATAATSPITVTVPNWETYSVTVTADNGVGVSDPSNALSTSVPALSAPVVSATDNLVGKVDFSWTVPTSGPTPDGYNVVVTPDPGSALTFNTTTRTGSIDPAAPGSHLIEVTPTYINGTATETGMTGSATGISVSSTLLYQNVDVNRPTGRLVLTQVCGSNRAFAGEAASPIFPAVDPVDAQNSSTVGAPTAGGTAPTTDGGVAAGPDGNIGTADDGALPGTTADADADGNPNKPEYPYPTDDDGVPNPNYPTYCGIDLGKAKFVTLGSRAGQFFAADGVINQITVVDTTDDDTGWTVSGQMSDFTANGGTDTFSGAQLGWRPVLTDKTDAFTDASGAAYEQKVTQGPVVDPNNPVGSVLRLDEGEVLASALANEGLGTAILDARLKLLIPVTADAGQYTGTLTITALSN